MSGLKVLVLRKKLDAKKAELKKLRESNDFETREKELEKIVSELNSESTEEEKNAVDEEVEKFETEKSEYDSSVTKLEDEIRELESEIEKNEKEKGVQLAPEASERGANNIMDKNFFNMTIEQRDAFFKDEKVKSFLANVRSAIKDKRAISNVGLLVPTKFIGLLRENVLKYSKLYSRVHKVAVKGKGREVIMGTIPEAVWTEMCAKLNELSLTFNDVEVDGFMVGGYFAICRAQLDDSDVDLASTIIQALAESIGYALDKAILYGKGVKMPLGVATRLAQTVQPENYSTTARTWANLSTTNLAKITGTGTTLLANLLKAIGVVKGKYSRGEKLWIMNEETYSKLMVELLNVNSAGAIVSGVNGKMPVVGGDIIVLDFVPAGDVICGYFDLYLLAEREGTRIEQSDHVQFIEDRRVFKGLARYDGTPVIAEAFAIININNTAPTTTVSFAGE